MLKHARIAVVLAGSIFMVSGCVSTGKYEALEMGKNKEIEALQGQKTAVEKDNVDLKQKVATLEQENAAGKQRITSLEQENAAGKQRIASLEQEKATLVTSSEQQQQQYQALVQGLSQEVEKGQLQVRQYKNMLSVDLAEQIFFDSGRATLKPAGKEILKKVGEALKGYDNKIIRVVGHTDNVPVAKSLQSTFPSNWELSVARATNVVRFLQEVGVPPERMIAAGRGEYDPVAPNDKPEGRQKNRRIEIMLIDKSIVSEMTRTTS